MEPQVEESSVSYEELADLEKDFEEIENEIIRKQALLQAPLYEKRRALVSKIPNFWPLVLEQAPPDIDTFIQPTDSAILATSLTGLDVTHFEIPPAVAGAGGDPRSVAIRLEFGPNEWFEDRALEKRFWFRRASDGWTGLVSDPVKISWKKGKDLSQGLTDAAVAAWEAEKAALPEGNGVQSKEKGTRTLLPEQEAVINKMETVTEGSLSFFSWFAFRGRHVTAEESEAATRAERERRDDAKMGIKAPAKDEETADQEEGDLDADMEVFPAGEELAVGISDDLFPGALKYFSQAQEDDGISDADFEEDDDDDSIVNLRDLVRGERAGDDSADERPKKKIRS
ncbi:MAG: hypothetical protein M1832_004470 [Thelocarpon impressellum]|nr:MAG: hypothetical protein M1832_004470 [Thelocarpon impressellum]